MKAASPYLTHQEAADYLRFVTVNAFDCWRYGRKQAGFPLKAYRRGRTVMFKQCDLDAAMQPVGERPALRMVK